MPMGAAGGIMQGVGAVLGTVGGIVSNIAGDQTRAALLRLEGMDPTYKANPIAAQRLALAKTLLQARMPGAQSLERNIYSSTGTQMQNIDRSATDSSEAISAKTQAVGQERQAFANLGTQEQQDFYNKLGFMTQAEQGQIAEGDKVAADAIRRWQDQVNITQARNQIRSQQGQTLVNMGSMWAGMGSGQLGQMGPSMGSTG